MFPVTRSVAAPVRVLRKLDDSEQRFRTAPMLSGWELQYKRLKQADAELIENFFADQKGAFDTSWVFPFEGNDYGFMCFEDDEFTVTESSILKFDLTLKLRQTQKDFAYDDTAPATYPTINGGVIVQLPSTYGSRFLTAREDMPSGLRYSFSERDYPVRSWSCNYPLITNSEAGALMNFFTSMRGKLRAFDFTEPNTGEVITARLGMDTFSRNYISYNCNSVILLVQAVAA